MKILIVDDKEENRYFLEALLAGSGYEVVSATNGAEALERLRVDNFDMIISDILMPVMDGFELCRAVKSDDAFKRILFVFYTSSYTDDRDEELAVRLGGDQFIRKPTEPDVLLRIIQDLIRDAKEGKVKAKEPASEDDKEVCKLYSERLVSKLEEKMLDLEGEIATRVQIEESLRASEGRYRLLAENVTDVIWTTDLKLRFTYISPSIARQRGYSAEEVMVQTIKETVTPAFHEIIMKALAEEMEIEKAGEADPLRSRTLELEARCKDGSTLWTEARMSFLRDEDGRVTGILGVTRDISERKRAEEELQQSYTRLQTALNGTIHALAAAVDIRDPYTAGHQRRVARLACAIAEEMDLSDKQIEGIRMAGLIHDIGKIGVPAEILSKPGRLTDTEFALIKAHAQIAYDILKTTDFSWPLPQTILQHHERMDGSGYPNGLKDDDILVEPRIIAVADTVEAMSSHRPYRPALGIDKALEEISISRGVKYDPEIVDACLKLFAEDRFEFEP